MRTLTIDGKQISDESDCWVIAEIGHNHQGSLDKAKELFKAAKECGADAVKLQKRDNRALFTAEYYNKPYENRNSFGNTYGEHREALELGLDAYRALKKYAKELEITMFSTPFDFQSADFLRELDMPCYKIASGDLKNIPLMKHVASFGKPMIVSVGGGSLDDVRRVYQAVKPVNPQICFLQCTMSYPTEPEEVNLRVIATLRNEFPDVVVGLSDHYNGIVTGPVAYTLGARVIEKHFTLNHAWKGTDHALSLEPIGLRKMVRDLRRIKIALGDGVKRVLPSEQSAMQKMGKSLVARHDLPAGHKLSAEDLLIKSPGGGVPPHDLEKVVGKKLASALRTDDLLQATHLKD